MGLDSYPTAQAKISSYWTQRKMGYIYETFRRHRITFSLLGLGNDVLCCDAKSTATTEQIDTPACIKVENYCASKDTIEKVNRKPKEWETLLQLIRIIRDLRQRYIKNP